MNKILIVDDEPSIRESFSLILGEKYKVLLAASGEAALKYAADQKIDLAYLDIRMPGLDGLETLRRLKEIDPQLEVIMVTAVNDVSKASEAIKFGARDYIIKPFDVDAILRLTAQVLRRQELTAEGKALRKTPGLIGQSEKIDALIKTVKKIAGKNLRVLILGEPGTEKEAVAELIHEESRRGEFPFLTFNLTQALTQTEIRNTLFGSEKGNTTADLSKKTGLLESGRGGTLFINHVEYLPAGLLANNPTEVRLIFGSCVELAEEAILKIPPLRERLVDLPLLTNHYIEIFSQRFGKEVTGLDSEAEEIFSNYSWPGNTAELKAILKRLVILAPTDQITAAELPVDLFLKTVGSPGAEYFSNFEKDYCRQILAEAGGDRERATAALGINQSLLESKL